MVRGSRRALGTLLSLMLLTLTFTLVSGPAAAASDANATVLRSGPDVSYPLRHDFSMAVGLPGHGEHEPTSCFDSWDGKGYLCRIVSGYEETGDKRNFLVRSQDALGNGAHPRFGYELISRGGVAYEGCSQWRNADWHCDYATRKQVSRDHYGSDRWVARVFWKWENYTEDQVGCTAAITGLWGGITGKGFLVFLADCDNGPL
ncbi:MAG TPA: hypothetical protein VGL92_18840 [Acidimicrobiia bacterium]|jgi:hypothetical protein